MIKLLRLDERLIHGQIAIKWSRHLSVNRILVLNDEAANNDLIKKSLMMAAPSDAKVAITTLEEGIGLLNDPRAESLSILVLVKTPQDALRIIQSVQGIKAVNIGNYGRVAPRAGSEIRKTYRNNLYLYDSEVQIIKQILATGVECDYQTTPEDKPEPIKQIVQ